MDLIFSLATGLALSLLIGVTAYWRGSLTRSGVLGAVLTGTAIFGFGGFVPGVLLVAFFVSSSVLSLYQARFKEKFAEKFQKGSRRDLAQALANGGWASLLAISYGLVSVAPTSKVQNLLFVALLGALATVTADTWATEIGVLSTEMPRMITTGRQVPAGTSGGVTTMGTLTALAGGLFIGAAALVSLFMISSFAPQFEPMFETHTVPGLAGLVLVAGVSGLTGSLFDSILGATVQAIYFCEYDEKQTEKRTHSCGRVTRLVRGWRWLDNDAVNFAASVVGSLVAVGLWLAIQRASFL